MYMVTLRESPDSLPVVIHSPYTDGEKLLSGNINQGINQIDGFDFDISFSNQGYGMLRPMRTIIEVRNIKNGFLEFLGRVITYSDNMTSDGTHVKTVVCENEIGYLHDSHQPYIEFSGKVENLFRTLISNHNNQVEEHKRFEIGVVDLDKIINQMGSSREYTVREGDTLGDIAIIHGVTIAQLIERNGLDNQRDIEPGDVLIINGMSKTLTNPRPNLIDFITPEESTFEIIASNIIEVYGGQLQVRNEDGIRYIDYVQYIGHDSSEDIVISKNLRSMVKKNDPTSIISRLIPLGEVISTEIEDDNEKRVTVASVNGGLIYVDRLDLINEFGIQSGSIVWDDISSPSVLLNRSREWMLNQDIVLQQFTIEALDLFKISKGVEEFNVGNSHRVRNNIMDLDEYIRVINKTVDIVSPLNSSLTIGDKFKTLIDYQIEQKSATQNINRIRNSVTSYSRAVRNISDSLNQVQTTISNSTIESLPVELNSINTQLEQIRQSITNLPNYGIVTPLNDGLMSVYDKVKMDRISVENSIDLDELVSRVIDLENNNQNI